MNIRLRHNSDNEKRHVNRHIISMDYAPFFPYWWALTYSALTKYKIGPRETTNTLFLHETKKRANMKGTKGAETKALIRKTAFQQFLSKDYSTVPLKDIEACLHLTRGCMSYHYPSKQELFIDVIDFYILHKQDMRQKAPDIAGKSLLLFLKYYVDKVGLYKNELSIYLESTSKSNITRAYLNLIAQAQRYYPNFDKIAYEIRMKEIFFWETLIKKAQEDGEIRSDLESSFIAQQFRYTFYGKSYDDSLEEGLDVKKMEEQFMFLYNIIKK